MRLLIVLTSFISIFSFSQEIEDTKVRFGLNLSSIFSSLEIDGITLAGVIDKKRNQFSIGSRILFDNYYRTNNLPYAYDASQFTVDVNYRWFLFKNRKRIRPYLQLTLEFQRKNYKREYYYEPGQDSHGPSFDKSFNLDYQVKMDFINLYFGGGVEIQIWRGFYSSINTGFGLYYKIENSTYFNLDSQQYELKIDKNGFSRLGYIASCGVGFRF